MSDDIVSRLQNKMEWWKNDCEDLREAVYEIIRIRAENERMRDVLRPFVDHINLLEKDELVAKYIKEIDINVELLRRARDAYNNTK